MFMELLDGSVLAAAAPRIAPDLGVPTSAMAAPISAYLVTVAALIPANGRVVDRFSSQRRVPVGSTSTCS
jgi:MFS family permease